LTKRRFGLILERMSAIKEGTSGPLARRGLLIGAATVALAAAGTRLVGAAAKPTITVHKSPT
jgi:hypothetical protein